MNDRLKAALGRTADCPSVEALATAPDNPDVQRHIEACIHCRAELVLLQEFESAEPQPEELASVQWIAGELRRRNSAIAQASPSPSAWSRFLAWLGAVPGPGRGRALVMVAASLLIVVTAGVYFRQSSAVRPPASGIVWRSGRFAAMAPSGEMAQSPVEFRWEAVPGAASYQVQLLQVDRTVIWTGESSQTTIEIPSNIRAQLRPGRAFQWQVTARNTAGESIASTDLQDFRITVR